MQKSFILLLFSSFTASTRLLLVRGTEISKLCWIAYHVSVIKSERATISVNFSVRFERLSIFTDSFQELNSPDDFFFSADKFCTEFPIFVSGSKIQNFDRVSPELGRKRTFLFPFLLGCLLPSLWWSDFYSFSRYLSCVSQTMKKLQPFGDVPRKLSEQLRRSFVATRTYAQALKSGRQILNQTLKVRTERGRRERKKAKQKFSPCRNVAFRVCGNNFTNWFHNNTRGKIPTVEMEGRWNPNGVKWLFTNCSLDRGRLELTDQANQHKFWSAKTPLTDRETSEIPLCTIWQIFSVFRKSRAPDRRFLGL